jgi:hypothetical protein
MTLVVSDEGDVAALTALLNAGTVKLRLFTNNVSPSKGMSFAGSTFTECADGSYAAITLTGGSWTIASVSHVTTAAYAKQTFGPFAGSTTIYGYYITQTISGTTTVLYAESASGAPLNGSAGSTVDVTPNIVAN